MKLLTYILLLGFSWASYAENFHPFFLAKQVQGNQINKLTTNVSQQLKSAKFKIINIYTPYKNAKIIIFSSGPIVKAAAATSRGAYAVAQRVAITLRGEETFVTYTNPTYMAHAFRLRNKLEKETKRLNILLGNIKAYGAGSDGLTPDQLSDYSYAFGMESFEDPIEVSSLGSYKKALKKIKEGFGRNDSGVTKLYEIKIPKRNVTIFGVAIKGERNKKGKLVDKEAQDDEWVMKIIDNKVPPSTAHLPYEILVSNKDVEALNSRFRIAVNFPTLRMMGKNSFISIMSTPEAIESAYKKLLDVTESVFEEDDDW